MLPLSVLVVTVVEHIARALTQSKYLGLELIVICIGGLMTTGEYPIGYYIDIHSLVFSSTHKQTVGICCAPKTNG